MISYGSQKINAETLCEKRSRPVYGSHASIAEMLTGERSHQLGEGHQCGAEMPTFKKLASLTHKKAGPRLIAQSWPGQQDHPQGAVDM